MQTYWWLSPMMAAPASCPRGAPCVNGKLATGLRRWAEIPHEHGVFDGERQAKIQPRASQNEPWVLWASRDGKLQNYELVIRGANLENMKITKEMSWVKF